MKGINNYMTTLCPEIYCKDNAPSTLITEFDKELCPKPKIPEPYQCSMVIVSVSSNIQSLQHKKTYEKVCDGRHKVDAVIKYNKRVADEVNYDHLCPKC